MTTPESRGARREEVITLWAEAMQQGRLDRRSKLTVDGEDITEAVHLVAGGETERERELRAAERERNMGALLGNAVTESAYENLFGSWRNLRVDGEDFEFCTDDDVDANDLVFTRISTGQRFRVEIDTYVEAIDKYTPPADDDSGPVPGPGQQVLA